MIYQRTYFQYKVYDNGYWAAEAYLASVKCLNKLGLENDIRNTYRAMLFDEYVNKLPQSKIAEEFLGFEEVKERLRILLIPAEYQIFKLL